MNDNKIQMIKIKVNQLNANINKNDILKKKDKQIAKYK